jgi:hypothetical protein
MDIEVIWGKREGEYFCNQGWTGQISLIPKAIFSSVVIWGIASEYAGRLMS